ncbi:pirin family protein [Litoribacter ruber]|uniref:Pirin family protein n=1 Tax=Litoribacter ruber TaxID=702568 RepID=A0AAP2G4L0_9BACT|nr:MULTISPECIES: pirin family protein [Litoribacter]MBS9524166.1 pirin family protein [Litoribacter alkaliphilus]MBT0810035.1 pirin family protein [Litoribacter ruber]
MKTIKQIHPGEFRPIADLITYSPMPTQRLQYLDPFLFLNHHGHQTYAKGNNGLPFGPHPHRGMETVTFILEGDISHKDSSGHESVIEAGGVQWMTAGKGLIHAEVSSDQFKKEGGPLEILQLWVNLPAKHKMTAPKYIGLQKEEINTFTYPEDEKVTIQLIAGEWNGEKGAFETLNPIFLSTIHMNEGGKFTKEVPSSENIFFYVVRGTVNVNGTEVGFRNLVEFANQDGTLEVSASEDAVIILGHAKPFMEPIVAQGPFVMNSQQEIMQAYQDYQQGKFGHWVD